MANNNNKNTYQDRRNAANQALLDAGEQIGIQKMWDYFQIALRDPEVVGKDVFGRKRLEKLYKRTSELADYFHLAFTDHKEADHRQEELDGALRDIWEGDLFTFYERYPQLKKANYAKSKKNWR